MSEMLAFACPHCGHEYIDEFEVLGVDRIHDIQCESCRQPYAMHLHECNSCAFETVLTWQHRPAPESIDALRCADCGREFNPSEELEE